MGDVNGGSTARPPEGAAQPRLRTGVVVTCARDRRYRIYVKLITGHQELQTWSFMTLYLQIFRSMEVLYL